MQKVTPFLWFDGTAEEAMNFYVSVFKNARIIELRRRGDDGAVMSGTFEIDGQRFHAFNGGPMFKFSEAVSLFVNCETQDEVDELWDKLSAGGTPQRCGWLKDRFGLSWQIIPSVLGKRLQDTDPAKAQRVVQAMMGMVKIDIAGIERAYAG
jgi:predicted 3-demethylubiquinone-9 3-methyltransferase (glyoxalase superfamily)